MLPARVNDNFEIKIGIAKTAARVVHFSKFEMMSDRVLMETEKRDFKVVPMTENQLSTSKDVYRGSAKQTNPAHHFISHLVSDRR